MPEDKKEKVSVIVPFYNVEQYLGKCIESILSQSYKNIELILVDDGSTDESGAICDKYEKEDSRIKVIHQDNEGPSGACNSGIASATGDYYCFVDGDDYIPNSSIENLYKTLQEYDADISIGVEEYFCYKQEKEDHWKRPFNNPTESFCMNTEDALRELLQQNLIGNSAWGKLYKKDVFSDVYFPERRLHQNKATIYRSFLKANRIAFCKECVYYYQIREDGITRGENKLKKCEDAVWAVEKQCGEIEQHYPDLKEEADARRLSVYFYAFINSDANDADNHKSEYWERIKMLRRNIIFNPTVRRKTRIAALVSLLGPSVFERIARLEELRKQEG